MENYTEYIDDYFAGNLNPEERKNFENQMETNKNFAEEVAFYLAAKQALRQELADERKQWFRQLASENVTLSERTTSAPVRKMWVYRLAAAAVFVGVILLAWNLFLQPSASPEQLADKYIDSHLENLSIKMTATLDSVQEGLRLYNDGQYDFALRQFLDLAKREPSNDVPVKNLGIIYLRLGNYDKALDYFHQLEKYSLAANPAIFYQALTLMKRNKPGDREQARKLLNVVSKNDLDEKETADRWLNKKW